MIRSIQPPVVIMMLTQSKYSIKLYSIRKQHIRSMYNKGSFGILNGKFFTSISVDI